MTNQTPLGKTEVARGAAFLDAVEPGWRSMIDLETLDLSDTNFCVLGQLWRDDETGAGSSPYLRGSWALHDYVDKFDRSMIDDYCSSTLTQLYGFEQDVYKARYDDLLERWIEEIGLPAA